MKDKPSKLEKQHLDPMLFGVSPMSEKARRAVPFSSDKPISTAYSVIDNDLARDNLENDLSAADLQDLS